MIFHASRFDNFYFQTDDEVDLGKSLESVFHNVECRLYNYMSSYYLAVAAFKKTREDKSSCVIIVIYCLKEHLRRATIGPDDSTKHGYMIAPIALI